MSITRTVGRLLLNKKKSKESHAFLRMAFLVLILGLTGCGRAIINKEEQMVGLAKKRVSIPNQEIFFNEKLFTVAVSSARKIIPEATRPKAVVVPHHLLAADIIAGVLARSRADEVKTVVIIGPNHDDKNASTIATANLEYQTPLGSVTTDSRLVEKFLADFRLKEVPEAFLNEHSVGAIVPFARHYFPQTAIMPILFNSTTQLSDVQAVAKWLADNLDEQSLVVVSTDFSHYLTQEAAEKNDKITQQLILNQKIEAIMGLNNGFVDSPPSLATILLFGQARGLAPKIVYHANANDFSEQSFRETTSYFGIIFQ